MSLKNNDLVGTVLPTVSLDEFEPKAGSTEEIIVVAFYLDDKDPADDLNTFIQRSYIDTVAVDTSPSTDDDGHYLVFVEFKRDNTFLKNLGELLKDVENITGDMDWRIKTYMSDGKTFKYDDPEIQDYIIMNPDEYTEQDDQEEELKESIKSFLQDSHIKYLSIVDKHVTLATSYKRIVAEVVDVGDYDAVIGRQNLSESAFNMLNKPIEATTLSNMLGNYDVVPLGNFLCIGKQNDDRVMLLKNTEIKYRG